MAESSIIGRIKAQFSSLPTRTIEVPEWGDEDGKPLIIYASPLTLSDKQRLHDIAEKEGYVARLASVLVMKACDAEGKKLFTIADKRDFMHSADSEVIARVVTEIMRAPTVEEAVKN